MKYKQYFRNNRAFTLIEVIVTLAILGVVVLAIGTFFSFGSNMYDQEKRQFNAQSDARWVVDRVTDEIRFASELELLSPSVAEVEATTSGNEYNYIYIIDGEIYKSTYDKSTSTRTTLKLSESVLADDSSFSGTTDNLNIRINSQDGVQNYIADSTIKLPNLSLNKTQINGSSDKAIKYKVPAL